MTGITRTKSAKGFVGLDIGGANTKAARVARGAVRSVSRPFEVWRDRGALTVVIGDALDAVGAGPSDEVALTMTAELSDAFRNKREGVRFVIDAARAALREHQPLVLTTSGALLSTASALTRPAEVAAANWVAAAREIAVVHPDALVIDVGSTTADIIPLSGGKLAAVGRTDLDRLMAGELVYSGVLRTNLAAIAPRVPVRDGWCPVSSELFAISADVHLILGHIAAAEYDCPTPDGRGATVELARERVARLLCSDLEQLKIGEVDAIAGYLYAEQVRQLEEAARRVGSRSPQNAPVVALGAGAFLARDVASRLGRPLAVPPASWGAGAARAAPAVALALMLERRTRGSC